MESIEKWKIPVSVQIFIGVCFFCLAAGWKGSDWYNGLKNDNAKNTLIMLQQITELKEAVKSNKAEQDNFKTNQAAYNSDQIDFRRRVETKFGWR